MHQLPLFVRGLIAVLVAVIVHIQPTPAFADGASEWQGPDTGRVRLIAGARVAEDRLLAGLEIDLQKGWKTYWRAPGDSGIPPVFDWKRSENVSTVKVLWPAPSRFKDSFGWNNGYKHDLVFPIEVTPEDPTKPVQLELKLFYGVCEELCIPGKANLSLSLPIEGFSGYQALINRSMRLVPKAVTEDAGVKVVAVQVDGVGKALSLNVTLAQKASDPVALFVEGPSELFFDRPQPQATDSGAMRQYSVKVDGAASPGSLKGAKLLFTAVQGELRLEQAWQLD